MDRDEANAPADAAAPAFAAWAERRGFAHRENGSLPNPTQLLRHGFMQEVRSLAQGPLEEIGEARIAHADFAADLSSGFEAHWFTVVLAPFPDSVLFANRVLCHDRGLSEEERSNPDAKREIIELEDTDVRLESEGLVARYRLAADHDQDQIRTWQLFDPSLIDWLTRQAPASFSFELQDGNLCCFVPGLLDNDEGLDALCAAAVRVGQRVGELAAQVKAGGSPADEDADREALLQRELDEHPFAERPETVHDAAKAFGHGPFVGDRAWKLGSEAFFREYARSIGFAPVSLANFRAAHLETDVAGDLDHAARGPLEGSQAEAYLVLTSDDQFDTLGWMTLIADGGPGAPADLSGDVQAERLKAEGYDVVRSGARYLIHDKDPGPRHRRAADLDDFIKHAGPLLARLIAGA